MLMPTTVPVSDLRNKHREVFGMLKDGPILLAARSRGEAVLVDIDHWNKLIKKLAKFEQQQTMIGIFEEMRNSEFRLECGGHVFDQQADRNCRGVGRNDRTRLAMLVNLRVQRFLDVQPFDDGFRNPVDIGNPVQIVLDVADRYPLSEVFVQQPRLILVEQPLNSAFRDSVA